MLWAMDFFPLRKKVSGVQILLASRLFSGSRTMGPLKHKRSSFQLWRKNTSMVYSWECEKGEVSRGHNRKKTGRMRWRNYKECGLKQVHHSPLGAAVLLPRLVNLTQRILFCLIFFYKYQKQFCSSEILCNLSVNLTILLLHLTAVPKPFSVTLLASCDATSSFLSRYKW